MFSLRSEIRRQPASRCSLSLFLLCALTAQADGYVPEERWSLTASGSTGGEGDPITLTWSLADDGTIIPDEGSSNLISYLDGLFSVTGGGSDLTTRPWFTLIEQSLDRWSQVGGITFVYEPNDDGVRLESSGGALGVRGDIRIGGAVVDGPSGTLAYATLPNNGDIVVDTGETNFYSNSANNYRQLRNTIMHEVGHAFGLLHIESSTDNLLMEPFITASIDGPQLDDIRGIHGLYGDALEKTNGGLGNDTAARATDLASMIASGSISIGADAASGQSVLPSETDFVSISNLTDIDFYSFSISSPSQLDITLTPLGGVFNQGEEGGPQSSFNANARNNLSLALFASNGTTLLASADSAAAGGIETLSNLSLAAPGDYFVRVAGSLDAVQLYQLDLAAASIMLVGDYNENGVVDAADFSVWRDTLGQTGSDLAADGNGNGIVDSFDYDVWKTNFGETSTGSAVATAISTTVAEPTVLSLFATAGLAFLVCCHRNRPCQAARA